MDAFILGTNMHRAPHMYLLAGAGVTLTAGLMSLELSTRPRGWVQGIDLCRWMGGGGAASLRPALRVSVS